LRAQITTWDKKQNVKSQDLCYKQTHLSASTGRLTVRAATISKW